MKQTQAIELASAVSQHMAGLQRLTISNPTLTKDANLPIYELANELKKVCKNSHLTYADIEKAIVIADNGLAEQAGF